MDFFRRIFGNSEKTNTAEESSQATDDVIPTPEPTPAPVDGLFTNDTSTKDSTHEPEADLNEQDFEPEQGSGQATAPVYIPDGVTRPLPAEPTNIFQPFNGHLTFGQSSDQGMVRSNNQDSALSLFFTSDSVDEQPDFGLFIVADGMGGHHDGEKASALTSRIVASDIINNIYLPLLNNVDLNTSDRPTISETLSMAVKRANAKVISDIPDGGTTLTAIVVMSNLAYVAHVGDSRAYLVKDHKIEQITRDHSLVQRLIELNQLSPEEAEHHQQRNVLYRAIGQNEDLEVDTLTRRLLPGSAVLICSDGLWGLIDEDDIQEIIVTNENPQDACEKLVALANSSGGHDNITAVIFKMPGAVK